MQNNSPFNPELFTPSNLSKWILEQSQGEGISFVHATKIMASPMYRQLGRNERQIIWNIHLEHGNAVISENQTHLPDFDQWGI